MEEARRLVAAAGRSSSSFDRARLRRLEHFNAQRLGATLARAAEVGYYTTTRCRRL